MVRPGEWLTVLVVVVVVVVMVLLSLGEHNVETKVDGRYETQSTPRLLSNQAMCLHRDGYVTPQHWSKMTCGGTTSLGGWQRWGVGAGVIN